MKRIFFYLVVIAALPLFWEGQYDNNTVKFVNTMQYDTNLIINPSFELDSVATDSAWYLNYNPNYPLLMQTAPTGGGEWSLGLLPVDNISKLDNADYYIKGINGSNNFTLTTWWKIAGKNSFVLTNGSVTVGVFLNDTITQSQSMTVPNSDTVWTEHTLNFSLTTNISDTIIVRLNGGTTLPSGHQNADGLFLFDNTQLVS